jgi:uncharacterized surface protein with fasciclin (FAS1) repeats
MRRVQLILAASAALVTIAPAGASPKGNIVAAAASTPDFSTLVTAVKAAKLTDTLASKGPFTVFAPTNDAFAKLPAGTVDTLLKPENSGQLTKVLTYHVVPGRYSAAAILAAIKAGGGSTTLTTVSGDKLSAAVQAGQVVLTDESGRTSTVTKTDLNQSNGIIHVIDTSCCRSKAGSAARSLHARRVFPHAREISGTLSDRRPGRSNNPR